MIRSTLKRMGILAGSGVLVAGLMAAGAGVAAAAPGHGCVQAGNSGFTAKVVAHSWQRISHRRINASGCDVGIYVADRTSHVTISGVTVTGANDAGILVQNTSHVTITRSVVHGNGFNAPAATPPNSPPGTAPVQGNLPQAFGISLFGVSNAAVTHNTVYNNGRGGIGVMDDGPFDPGQIFEGSGTTPALPVPVRNVTVSGNVLWKNYSGCAIVVSAFNASNMVRNVNITRNTVIGTGFDDQKGADIGGIVAQSNGPFSTVANITISRNTVMDSVEAGVIVHAAAPGSTTKNVQVSHNLISGNNVGVGETGQTTGVVVSVIGPPPGTPLQDGTPNPGETNQGTVVTRNIIIGQFYGVWTSGPNPPRVSRNWIWTTSGGTRYFVAPSS